MKKTLFVLFALIALFGVTNCFLLEPALAIQEEAACLLEDDCDCCFICGSFSHQTLQSSDFSFSPSMNISKFILMTDTLPLVTLSTSIFHPPLVF